MILRFKFFQSVSGGLVKNISAALKNMLQSHSVLSTNDLGQQQISTHVCNTTENDQRPQHLSKFVGEPKDIKSTSGPSRYERFDEKVSLST
jgi:hypothetical protein